MERVAILNLGKFCQFQLERKLTGYLASDIDTKILALSLDAIIILIQDCEESSL